MIDTLEAYDELKKAKFSEEQTRGLVTVFKAVTQSLESLMTEKMDDLRKDISRVQKEIDGVSRWVIILVGLVGASLTLNIAVLAKIVPLLK